MTASDDGAERIADATSASRVALLEVASIPCRYYVDELLATAMDNVLPRELLLDGRDGLEVLAERFPDRSISYAQFRAGHCCPRIWRFLPEDGEPEVEGTEWFSSFIDSVQQAEVLTDELNAIFRVVHPSKDTAHVYGTEIRTVLILACTEVEAQCKAVLKANHVGSARCTSDYARLYAPMGLEDYSRALCRFPGYEEIRPFAGWNEKRASESLPWYHAYNLTKHDREQHLRAATLEHAISAVAAVEILLRAQFGRRAHEKHQTRSALRRLQDKIWDRPNSYHRPRPGEKWRSVDFTSV